MDVRIKLRFNKVSGEVEELVVEDAGGSALPRAEHEREHDRIAADFGRVLERRPRVEELVPGAAADAHAVAAALERARVEAEAKAEAERARRAASEGEGGGS